MATAPLTDEQIDYTVRRMRRLPGVIEAAERKLAGLYSEAKRLKMDDLLDGSFNANAAWEREIAITRLEALLKERGA